MAASLVEEIKKLKEQKDAVILVHNYQLPEVQDVADYLGDSLGLSIEASKVKAKVIVFCGVHFMAETAAILNPDKIVVMPDLAAGCPMADMITAKALKMLKAQNPKAKVVCYVNTSAEVKAESDICCTSANAVKVVQSLPDKEIIFVPDKYLGAYVASRLPEKKMVFWPGYCPTHVRITAFDLQKARQEHPAAEVLVHPECTPEVIQAADQVFSTGGMIRYVKQSPKKEFIIGTETGIIYRMEKENPGKKFYPAAELAVCPNMKKNNLEKVLWVLEALNNRVTVKEEVQRKVREAIERMLALQ